jgi:hypothetical protein
MRYYLFNIGWPYTDKWWARHVSMGIISTGFENTPGDRGERILQSLETGDWVIAYANRYGAIGAGVVGEGETYRLVRRSDRPSGFESAHRHFRSVRWVYYVESLVDAVPFVQLKLLNRRTQTKTELDNANARRIIKLLAKRSVHAQDELEDEEADWVGLKYVPNDDDHRQLVQRQIRERRGQQPFRNALLKRFGHRCIVTGCQILAVLEAAHINPYRGEKDNDPQNGLLLRSDIHTLFDLNLLGIDPEELRVILHPVLRKHPEYGDLLGRSLSFAPGQRPSLEALRLRHELFRKRASRPT